MSLCGHYDLALVFIYMEIDAFKTKLQVKNYRLIGFAD